MNKLSIPHVFGLTPSQTIALMVKNSFFDPNKPAFFKTTINKQPPLPNINENFSDNSLKPSIDFRKFKVKNNRFTKKSNSLSPKNKFPADHKIARNDNFDLSKLKKIKEMSQESEIRLQHLYNQFREGVADETERLKICFQMIESVFM